MAEGLATAMLDSFVAGYELPGRLRARAAAKDEFGAAAEDPGLFSALREDRRAEAGDEREQEQHEQMTAIRGAQEGRDAATFDYTMETAEETRKRKAVLGLLNGLRSARDRGEDIGEAFDQQVEVLRGLGISDEDIPAMREAIIEDPAKLDDYHQTLTTAEGTTSSGGKPSDRERARQIMNDKNATAADKQWASSVMGTDDAGDPEAQRTGVDRTIDGMLANLDKLDEIGAVRTDTPDSFLDRIGRGISTSAPGQAITDFIGTDAATLRQDLQGARVAGLQHIIQLPGMSARMFDTDAEKKLWLSRLGDMSMTIQAQRALLKEFKRAYGAGEKLTADDLARALEESGTDEDGEPKSDWSGTSEALESGSSAIPDQIWPGFTVELDGEKFVYKGLDADGNKIWEAKE